MVDSLSNAFSAPSTVTLPASMFIAVLCGGDTRKLSVVEHELHESESVNLNYLIGFSSVSEANTFSDAVTDEHAVIGRHLCRLHLSGA